MYVCTYIQLSVCSKWSRSLKLVHLNPFRPNDCALCAQCVWEAQVNFLTVYWMNSCTAACTCIVLAGIQAIDCTYLCIDIYTYIYIYVCVYMHT